ncbi:MAG TPA: hypothetical protein VIV60_04595, partial [Polyangiaceae bacterium]
MISIRAFALVSITASSCFLNCGGKDEATVQPGDGSGNAGSGAAGGRANGGVGGRSSSTSDPQIHLSECEALCARTADAGCSAGADSCVLLCATVTGFS